MNQAGCPSAAHRLSSTAVLDFLDRIEEAKLAVNSLILLKDGETAAQYWRAPYRPDRPQLLYSLSKSFTSIAVGIAWDEGLLELDAPVVSFFPDRCPETISPRLARMTVHHLLSMNAGHEDPIYEAVARERDWVRAFLSQEVTHEPGTRYRYSTHATYMLSAILERVAGEPLVDYLMPRLFEPIGIARPVWETCPLGVAAGGMGLSIPTEGIARFGQMLLDEGVYKGQRIVSAAYIRMATAEQSDNRAEAKRIDSAQGYGYQFHLCRRGCYRGDGSFGQLCFVAPKERLVIAATASFPGMDSLQTLLNLVYECLLDRMGQADADPADAARLQERLAERSAPWTTGMESSGLPNRGRDGCYRLTDNPHGLRTVRFRFRETLLWLEMNYEDERDQRLPFDLTGPAFAQSVFPKDLALHRQDVVTRAAWLGPDIIRLTLHYIETPYVVVYTIRFEEERIDWQFEINVSLNMTAYRSVDCLQIDFE
ncbi:serine hydrolase [Cohnella sp. REN36]|uniref:serine hydrolase domain-containing protein n=1 Tax=Cohnella sp. REN36 TaxID=2887347 RepID=UPI001D142D69|nr:serine hydrolase [Cohnella sp. REN36]MCC3372481.1 beta-lactamase family protein [Cohnella sp. REN36]